MHVRVLLLLVQRKIIVFKDIIYYLNENKKERKKEEKRKSYILGPSQDLPAVLLKSNADSTARKYEKGFIQKELLESKEVDSRFRIFSGFS